MSCPREAWCCQARSRDRSQEAPFHPGQVGTLPSDPSAPPQHVAGGTEEPAVNHHALAGLRPDGAAGRLGPLCHHPHLPTGRGPPRQVGAGRGQGKGPVLGHPCPEGWATDCSDPQDLPRAQPQGLTRVHRGHRGMDGAGSLAHPRSLECNGPHLGRRLLGDQG